MKQTTSDRNKVPEEPGIIRAATVVSVLLLVATALAPDQSHGRVDPEWLKSWNEAQLSRPATMTSRGRIAAENEPGQPLVIHGQVVAPDGGPAEGVVVHAYHRDHHGYDFGPNDTALTSWRLQGWVMTDADGRFEFRTIRPVADHMGRDAAHFHFTLESRDYGRQWAPMVYLADDPLVTPDQRRRSSLAGEFRWVLDVQTRSGIQYVQLKLRLKARADF